MIWLPRRGPVWVRGERAVVWWLRLRGWRILGRNLRIGHDELDIVAVMPRQRVLAILEVKSTAGASDITWRVDQRKQWRVARAASRLPRRWTEGRRLRFDVAVVTVGPWRCHVTHMPAAFDDER